jgi:hypothetical protein
MEMIHLVSRGFTCEAERQNDGSYYGKLTNIKELVSFECLNKEDIAKEFEDAIDDYLLFQTEFRR